MDDFFFQSLLSKSKKRRSLFFDDEDTLFEKNLRNLRENPEEETVTASQGRYGGWEGLYQDKTDEEELKDKVRVTRATFDRLLDMLYPHLWLEPTNLKPNPLLLTDS